MADWEWAGLNCGFDWGHIRYLGDGGYWFRPYGGSLLKSRNAGPAKSKQKALAPTLGTSPRLGVPVIRHEFGGPPPRAIHGAGRLNRHPCRFTPQIHAEFRPACLTGRLRSKSKAKRGGLVADLIGEVCAFPCGSWLACDGINWVCLMYRVVCIAGKPAPTFTGSHS